MIGRSRFAPTYNRIDNSESLPEWRGSTLVAGWCSPPVVDLFAGREFHTFAGATTLSIGVNNLFDQNPPKIYTSPQADSSVVYDYAGRFFYLRLTQLL